MSVSLPSSPELPTPSYPAVLLGTVEAAYARYEQQAAQFMQGFVAQSGQVYCGAGCFGCCNMPIRLSLAEAALIASVLSETEAKRVEKHAHKVIHNAHQARSEDEYVLGHRLKVGYCPLLGPDGACTRYAVRPTRCRDTYSAMPAVYCEAGAWEAMTPAERRAYQQQVRRTPGTDGETHFIEPLEQLSEPVWQECARAMQLAWQLEAWGDFWVLVTLARSHDFMGAITAGRKGEALKVARRLGLEHPELLELV